MQALCWKEETKSSMNPSKGPAGNEVRPPMTTTPSIRALVGQWRKPGGWGNKEKGSPITCKCRTVYTAKVGYFVRYFSVSQLLCDNAYLLSVAVFSFASHLQGKETTLVARLVSWPGFNTLPHDYLWLEAECWTHSVTEYGAPASIDNFVTYRIIFRKR